MKNQFVSYNTAIKLKEIGFNDLCIALYNREKALRINDALNNPEDRNKDFTYGNANNFKYPAPLFSQVIDWFRIKHDLILTISSWDDGKYHWTMKMVKGTVYSISTDCVNIGRFDDYYDCLYDVINEGIEYVYHKNKNKNTK